MPTNRSHIAHEIATIVNGAKIAQKDAYAVDEPLRLVSPSNKNIGINMHRRARLQLRQVKRGEHKYKKQENFGSFSLSCYNMLVFKLISIKTDSFLSGYC